jgi:DNA polymerase-4
MASDLNKPNGQVVITPRMGPGFVEALAVKKFHGVGLATAAKMEGLGILTGADLKAKSLPFLQEHFGKSGARYFKIARRIDERPVQPERPRKSVGAEDTFAIDIFDIDAARAELSPLIAKFWRHCEAKQLRSRTITLKVKYADFQLITRSRTLDSAIETVEHVEAITRSLLDPLFPTAKGTRLLGVTLSTFDGGAPVAPSQLCMPL